MGRFWLIALGLAVFLGGCFNQKDLIKKLVPDEDDRQARHFLELVRDGRDAEVRALLSDALLAKDKELAEGLDFLRQLFNRSKWQEVETIGYAKNWTSTVAGGSQTVIRLDYQIRMEKHWAAGTVQFVEKDGVRKIASARFDPLPNSLEIANALTFSDKGLLHYATFFATLAVPLFCLVVLVLCIRTRMRGKWRWILFILLPVAKFSLNWTTGEWGAQVLAFQLLGASIMRGGLYSPWILGVSFPVGAIWFLVTRKSLAIPAAPVEPVPPPVQ